MVIETDEAEVAGVNSRGELAAAAGALGVQVRVLDEAGQVKASTAQRL